MPMRHHCSDLFFFSGGRRHTRSKRDWSSDVCSSDLERLRLEAYRNLAQASDTAAVEAAVEELQDRYGELPEAAQNLVAVANFRNTAREYGVHEVMLMGKNIKDRKSTRLNSSHVSISYAV